MTSVEHRVGAEVPEDLGGRELTERAVAVDRHYVRHLVLDEPGAQRGLGVRRVVDDDPDVRVLLLELLASVLEVAPAPPP